MTHFRSRLTGRASRAVLLGAASALALTVAGTGSAFAQTVIFEGLGPGQTDVCTNANGQVVGRTGDVFGVEQCSGGTQPVTGIQVQGTNTTTINDNGLTAGTAPGSQTIINDSGITTEANTTSNFGGTQTFGGTNNFSGTQTYSGTNDFTTGLTVSGGSLQVGGVQIDSATGDVTGVNNISANNSVSAGGHITANGDINSANGSVNAAQHVTAGTGVTATNGNITAQNGNINAANGSVNAAQHVTAGTGVTATNGNITAVNGNVNAGGSVNAGTFVTAKQDVIAERDVIAGRDTKVGRNLEVIGTGTFGGMLHANGGLTVAEDQTVDMGMNRVQNVGTPIHAFDATNKAYVDAADAKLEEGIAVSLALQNPDLVGTETFGLAVNWGNFEGSNAIGIAAAGVLGNNFLMPGDRLAIAGGIGIGLDENTVGGRVGIQWTR